MAQRLIWSAAAADDLQSIVEYIARDSPRYAAAVADKILALTGGLSRHRDRQHHPWPSPLFTGYHRVIG